MFLLSAGFVSSSLHGGIGETCSICQKLAANPVKTPSCRHTFCSACLARWFNEKAQEGRPCTCPACRRNLTGMRLCPTPPTPRDMVLAINPQAALPVTPAEIAQMAGWAFPSHQHDEEDPLLAAVERGREDIVAELLRLGFDAGTSYKYLHLAAEIGHVDVVRTLLQHGVNPNIVDETHRLTALMLATNKGHRAITQLLLEHGARLDMRTTTNLTAVYIAASRGRDIILLDLLMRRANANPPPMMVDRHCGRRR